LQLRLALGEWQGITDTEEKGMRYSFVCARARVLCCVVCVVRHVVARVRWCNALPFALSECRYAHMCSEVFCMDVKPIQDYLLGPEADTGAPFLARLLAVLDRDPPLYVVPVQNLCKIVSSLIKHRRKEVMTVAPLPSVRRPVASPTNSHKQTFEALTSHPGLVKRLAVHAAGSSPRLAEVMWLFMEDESVDPLGVIEVLKRATLLSHQFRLTTHTTHGTGSRTQWLDSESLVPQLLTQLNNDKGDVEVSATALSVLTQIVERSDASSPLAQSALSEASVQQVIAFTFAHVAEVNESHAHVRFLFCCRYAMTIECAVILMYCSNNVQQRKRLVSGLEFVRSLLDWCVSSAPGKGDETSKKKRALWLVGVESKNADNTGVRLDGTARAVIHRSCLRGS